jgi:hypothetical protein
LLFYWEISPTIWTPTHNHTPIKKLQDYTKKLFNNPT